MDQELSHDCDHCFRDDTELHDGRRVLEALRPRSSREGSLQRDRAAAAAWSIADLAGEFGITEQAIRFYEERGLLQPRGAARGRAYGPRERLHLKMILEGEKLGFTLSEIRDILGARGVKAEAQDFASDDFSAASLVAIGMQRAGRASGEAVKLDLAMALRPEQIAAQIDHLERQRRVLDDALLALREAHARSLASHRRRSAR